MNFEKKIKITFFKEHLQTDASGVDFFIVDLYNFPAFLKQIFCCVLFTLA